MLAYIIPIHGTVDPGYGVGLPVAPVHPSQGLPVQPGHPEQGLPPPPPGVTLPVPPPGASTKPIYPEEPGKPLPPPGTIWPPLGPEVPKGKALAAVWIQGYGVRWAVIDTSQVPVPK